MTNKKLHDYVENMEIPKPEDVLPKECVKSEEKGKEENVINDNFDNVISKDTVCIAAKRRRWMYATATGLVACCAAFSLMVIKPWDKQLMDSSSSAVDKKESSVKNDSTSEDKSNKGEESVSNKEFDDGVIGESTNKETGEGLIEGIFESEEMFATDDISGYPLSPEVSGTDAADTNGVLMEGTDGDTEVYYEPGVNPGVEYSAGTLTGGEIRDLRNWDNWSHVADLEYLTSWKLLPKDRIAVYVHNGDNAVNNVKVKLLAGDKVIYESVTANDGYAYLFYNFGEDASVKPDSIEVENKDGDFDSYSISENANNKNEIEISSEITNDEVKLDLMFVVDTTGSMQDELDYLKAELEDVIERVEGETGATIRTSVNFYRDEGDEYEVKYYDFREDAKEVTKILSEQNADGGGDWEEAVHKALDNAINGHNWSDESTVKLMFLVLDAPPHDDEEIKTKLAKLVEEASAQGIRIIPVAASGTDENTQQLLRSFAIMTGGTFIFLDDNSGVGAPHDVPLEPNEYNSEYLNDMLIRIIGQYCGVDIDSTPVQNPQPTVEPNPNEN